ncbi:MAG: 50S ribosomal protein L4 [Proteobacteria bacterium]|nr:50S ribosomal protein L4 [Pseudomonadota bacterium]
MAVVDIINVTGDKVSQIELADDIFNVTVNGNVLHEVVRMQLASRRSGTACVKNRSDVRGSTRKLFRQKGTGNARPGSVRSPLRRGGGVVFGPHPKSWGYKVPKKVRRLALKMALSSKFQDQSLRVIDKIELDEIKTKKFVDIMNKIEAGKTLIISDGGNINLELSAKNVPGIKVMPTEGLNVYDILKYETLLILESSIKGIEGRLSA